MIIFKTEGIEKEASPRRLIAIPDMIKTLVMPMVSAISPVCKRPIIEGNNVMLPYIEKTLPNAAGSIFV